MEKYKAGDEIEYNENIIIATKPISDEEAKFYLGFLKEDNKDYVKFDIYEKDHTVWEIDSLISELVVCKNAMFYLPIPQNCPLDKIGDGYMYSTEEVIFIEEEIASVEQIIDFAKGILKNKCELLGD